MYLCRQAQLVFTAVLVLLSTCLVDQARAASGNAQRAMMRDVSPAGVQGWEVVPLLTIGEQGEGVAKPAVDGTVYRPPGRLDGIAAFAVDEQTVRVLVNHELGASEGYAYTLDNGTQLTGARVSYFDIDPDSLRVKASGLAYGRVLDRSGRDVSGPGQLNEGAGAGGFDSLCSAQGVLASDSAFIDDLYFTGEEVDEFGDAANEGLGGQETVIDVWNRTAYVVPMLGRAAFENVTPVETGTDDKIALVIGDDREAGPLYLYLGQKNRRPAGRYRPPDFLVRNGLGMGRLYVWVAEGGERTPEQFHGTGSWRSGYFINIAHYAPASAGQPDHDALGFASLALQDERADARGAFKFSRPEDVAPDPANGFRFALASTGRGSVFPADNWGTIYQLDIAFGSEITGPLEAIERVPARARILYDGDDAGNKRFAAPDFGLRSPDNLEWAGDGYIYIQEDRATMPRSLFGRSSGREASVWRLNPATGELVRILEMDRSAIPAGQRDARAGKLGAWESSGVVDVSELFKSRGGDGSTAPTTLLLTVQAHGLKGGGLADADTQARDLTGGGQLLMVRQRNRK